MQKVSLNSNELKGFLTHIINNNQYIQDKGKTPVAIEVVGESGIGKTSSILQLANETNLNFVKLNLAQIEELGDLVGFPIRQFEVTNGKETKYVDENVIDDARQSGFKPTGNNRMSYCPPEWIAGKEEGGILLLDDWNRADMRFIQAVMELVDRQQYISWSLPKNWHIILTSNPDTDDYIVNSIDAAQKTRFISVDLKFDVECWASWAEENHIDSRCINFLLMHPELVSKKVNSRSIVMFFNSISSIESFEDSLGLIQMIGEGSVGPEFASMFSMFINNKLDKLVDVRKVLFDENEESVLRALKSNIGTGDNYRADIASTLTTRLVNNVIYYAKDNKVEKSLIDRIGKIVTEDILNNDLKYHLVKSIYGSDQKKFSSLALNKDLVKYILK
jgi:hypothetical protein